MSMTLKNKLLWTGCTLWYIMIYVSYYYGYLEFEFSDSYIHLWYTYVNINNMRIFLNPWYLTMGYSQLFITIQFYYFYQKYTILNYTILNYTLKLNCISYILINTLLTWCVLPFRIINIVYTPITRRFSNRPEFIYVYTSAHVIETITDNRVIPDNNGFNGTDTVCAVCLDECGDNMLSCGHHVHHRPCLMTWLITSKTSRCPTCRTELELSKEDLLEIRNEPVKSLIKNNNIFDNILNYFHKVGPRLYYNRDLTA